MIPRSKILVLVKSKFNMNSASVVIRYQDAMFVLYGNETSLEYIATCSSAKRLSDWCFENGAWSVKHDYDLKLSDDEL